MLLMLAFAVSLQDLMKCTPDEILALAIQKLHPSLDSAFREAGMPVEQSSASSGNNLTVTGEAKAFTLSYSNNCRTVCASELW